MPCREEPCHGEASLCERDRTGSTKAQIRPAIQLLVQPLPQGRVHSQQDPQTLHLQTAMTTPPHLSPPTRPFLSVQVSAEGVLNVCARFNLHKFCFSTDRIYQNKILCAFSLCNKNAQVRFIFHGLQETQFERGDAIHPVKFHFI